MNITPYSAYLIDAAERFPDCQDTTSSKSCRPHQAFFNTFAAKDNLQCTVSTDENTKNYLQQTTVAFHNPFDIPRFEKRSIAIINNQTEGHQSGNLPAGIKPLNNEQAPKYIPDNEPFSIQSILELGKSTSAGSSVVNTHDKVCSRHIKHKARKRTWENSQRGKDWLKNYSKTKKAKDSKSTWAKSARGRAYHQDYQKTYAKTEQRRGYLEAYKQVKKNTGDNEQASFAGRQASALIRAIESGVQSTSIGN
ncbi:hypothetical protein [Endozoicomonas sp. ONNA2]|uniref:hypothetical protein n=1 Tax=Endozoicomonas sp. ONNA2 TaxID=2828741 RepID=UPI0021496074|nr:hypothetical protein [Endozoicomonas sp. ONNA2]